MDMQDEFDYDYIRGNPALLMLYHCLYPAKDIHQHVPEVCGERGHLRDGYHWLRDCSVEEMFRLFYHNLSLVKIILAPMSALSHSNSPTTSRKRASSSTDTAQPKKIRKKAVRTARIAQAAADQPTLPLNADGNDSTSPSSALTPSPASTLSSASTPSSSSSSSSPPSSDTDSGLVSMTLCLEGTLQPAQGKKTKAKKDKRHNNPPHTPHVYTVSPPGSIDNILPTSERETPCDSASQTSRSEQSAGPLTPESTEGSATAHFASSPPCAPRAVARNGNATRETDQHATRYEPRQATVPNQQSSSQRKGRRDSIHQDQNADNHRSPTPFPCNRSRPSGPKSYSGQRPPAQARPGFCVHKRKGSRHRRRGHHAQSR